MLHHFIDYESAGEVSSERLILLSHPMPFDDFPMHSASLGDFPHANEFSSKVVNLINLVYVFFSHKCGRIPSPRAFQKFQNSNFENYGCARLDLAPLESNFEFLCILFCCGGLMADLGLSSHEFRCVRSISQQQQQEQQKQQMSFRAHRDTRATLCKG